MLATSTREPTALVTAVTAGAAVNGYFPYTLGLHLVGLAGQPVVVVWRTVYDDDSTDGGTSGSFTTGRTSGFASVRYDPEDYTARLAVQPPAGSTNGRPWHTRFTVSGPGNAVLATTG